MARNRARRAATARPSTTAAAPRGDTADAELAGLVGAWLTLPEVAERCGRPAQHVRHLLAEGELRALRLDGRLQVPELFLVGPDGAATPLPDLRGTLVVLDDSGFDPAQGVRWLFTPDDSLAEGRPVDALRAGRKAEIRRRAQALAL